MPEKFSEVYAKWKRGELTAKEAMRDLGLSASSFYRMVKKYEIV